MTRAMTPWAHQGAVVNEAKRKIAMGQKIRYEREFTAVEIDLEHGNMNASSVGVYLVCHVVVLTPNLYFLS